MKTCIVLRGFYGISLQCIHSVAQGDIKVPLAENLCFETTGLGGTCSQLCLERNRLVFGVRLPYGTGDREEMRFFQPMSHTRFKQPAGN